MRDLSGTRPKLNRQVYVLAGAWDRRRRWERIKWSDERSSNNWPTSHTNWRQIKRMGWGDQVCVRSSNNCPSSRTSWKQQIKRMGWDDQMRCLQKVDQVHLLSRDGWRGWDGMMRWEVFKQLTKFTYFLKTDEEDGMGWSDERSSSNWPSPRTNWRRMMRIGWDDQMKGLQTIDQVHVQTGDGWRGWIGWSDERSSNNWPSSRTSWRRMKRMRWDDKMRGLQTINQVYLLSGDGWRRQNETIRWEVFKQLTKFTYPLEMDEEDGWDDQIRSHQSINQVYVLSGDRWRRQDGIIRWEVVK